MEKILSIYSEIAFLTTMIIILNKKKSLQFHLFTSPETVFCIALEKSVILCHQKPYKIYEKTNFHINRSSCLRVISGVGNIYLNNLFSLAIYLIILLLIVLKTISSETKLFE